MTIHASEPKNKLYFDNIINPYWVFRHWCGIRNADVRYDQLSTTNTSKCQREQSITIATNRSHRYIQQKWCCLLPHMSDGFSNLSLFDLSRDFKCCILSTIMETSSSQSALSWVSVGFGGLALVAFVSAVFSMSSCSQVHQNSTQTITVSHSVLTRVSFNTF